MSTVYVVQESKGKDLDGAREYGHLVTVLSGDTQHQVNTRRAPEIVAVMKEKLSTFQPRDYLLAIGDPVAIGIAFSVVAERTHGKFHVLKWDRVHEAYYVVEVDLGQN